MKISCKKIFSLIIVAILLISSTGCDSSESKINSNSQLASAKKIMMENLNNFSYEASITVKTGIMDVTTTMDCKEDRQNQIGYCSSSTMGVQTEEYFDYKNMIDYTRTYSPYSSDASNGVWQKTKIENNNTNSWLNLNDYIFNITEESKNGGVYYTGTIDSKKLAAAMSTVKSDIDMKKIVSDDINIAVFVNSSGYIEQMSFDMEIMGIDEVVEVNFSGFNTTGIISIPTEVKG